MRRILKAVQKDKGGVPDAKQDLEINPRHPIIVGLHKMRRTDAGAGREGGASRCSTTRCVAAGLLDDPRAMLARLNELLERVLTAPSQ